jgi:hypothetical protein
MAAAAVLRQSLDPQAQHAPLVARLGARRAQAFAKKADLAHPAELAMVSDDESSSSGPRSR